MPNLIVAVDPAITSLHNLIQVTTKVTATESMQAVIENKAAGRTNNLS